MRWSPEQRRTLLDLARQSIARGLETGCALVPDLDTLDPALREDQASFVTLEIEHRLRGCIGTLTAHQPLARDVAQHAFEAAFMDPRFPPVTRDEAGRLSLHISILGPSEPIRFTDEPDLLKQLRPGRDGLILDDGRRRATFLPSVWDELPDPAGFLRHLKRKGGWREREWPETMRAWRYETESFG